MGRPSLSYSRMGAESIEENGGGGGTNSPSCLSDKDDGARAKQELRIEGLRQRLRYFQASLNKQPCYSFYARQWVGGARQMTLMVVSAQ